MEASVKAPLLKTLYFSSLGCSKNLVDSQVMLGHLVQGGYRVVAAPGQAQVIVVNTCSFIAAAKEESIDTVLELAEYKKNGQCQALVMAGCMAQRYSTQLEDAMPEVDLFIGTGEYHKIAWLLDAWSEQRLPQKSVVDIPRFIHTDLDPRINTSPPYMAWLKVSEGCDRRCTFCIIPALRGKLRSRRVASLVEEGRRLAGAGVVELNIISQDLSDFGRDTGESLLELLEGLNSLAGIRWIRLFYYYPEDMSEEVMSAMAELPKVCRYLDMPVQHFSSQVLKRMNRSVTREVIYHKLHRLREKIPGIALRTSLMVGFPGETEEDFSLLLEGIEYARFEHLGVFQYSDEEGTPAYRLGGKLPPAVIEQRYHRAYERQCSVAGELNRRYLGQSLEVLVEEGGEGGQLWGRHQGQAPDIDGQVMIVGAGDGAHSLPVPGEMVQVEITKTLDYDLEGRLL